MHTLFSLSLFFTDLIERIDIHRTDKVNMKLKTFYDSCMNVNQIRTKGFIPGKYINAPDFLCEY